MMAASQIQELQAENAQLRQELMTARAARDRYFEDFRAARQECAELLTEYLALVRSSRDDVRSAVEMAGGIYTQVAQTFMGTNVAAEPLPEDSQAPVEEDGLDWTDFETLPSDGGVRIAEPGELDGELDEGDGDGDVEPGETWGEGR